MRIYINGVYNIPDNKELLNRPKRQQELRMHWYIKNAILESAWYDFIGRSVVIDCDIKEFKTVFRLSVGDKHAEFTLRDTYDITRQSDGTLIEPRENYPIKEELKKMFKGVIREMLDL